MNKPAALILLLALVASPLFGADTAQSKQDEEAWRAKRTAALLAPDGWFSLVGLDWLRPGKTTVGTATDNTIQLAGDAAAHVAVFDLEGQQVQLLPPDGGFPAGLTVGGKPAQAGPVSEETPLKIGTFTLVAIQRGDRFALRIKDAKAQTLLQFHGLNWYAPDEKYRVLAKWLPYAPPHDVVIPTILGTHGEGQSSGSSGVCDRRACHSVGADRRRQQVVLYSARYHQSRNDLWRGEISVFGFAERWFE